MQPEILPVCSKVSHHLYDHYDVLTELVVAYNGLGVRAASPVAAGRNNQLRNEVISLIANQITYAISLSLVKCSLILSLIRIFHLIRTIRIVAYITMILSICWAVQTILIGFLICRPFAYSWDQVNHSGTCGNLNAAYVSIGIVDVCTDLVIFILPLPLISKLTMQRSTKFATMGLFALGLCTVAAGAARTGMFYHTRFDLTHPVGPTVNLICAAIESCVAIIVASLLVSKPLFLYAAAKFSSLISSLPCISARPSRRISEGSGFGNTIRASATRSKSRFSRQKSDSETELHEFEGRMWQTTDFHVDVGETNMAQTREDSPSAYPKMTV